MATITEDYVSFEMAKLLKERGFDIPCDNYYDSSGKTPNESVYGGANIETFDYNADPFVKSGFPKFKTFSAPTFQMVMKWLREMHKIYIDISPTYSEVEKTIHFIWQIFDSNYDGIGDCEIFYGKYETACEEAIKYCLEDLI